LLKKYYSRIAHSYWVMELVCKGRGGAGKSHLKSLHSHFICEFHKICSEHRFFRKKQPEQEKMIKDINMPSNRNYYNDTGDKKMLQNIFL
jgi:hypothetical protein